MTSRRWRNSARTGAREGLDRLLPRVLLLAALCMATLAAQAQCENAPKSGLLPEVVHAEPARVPPHAIRNGQHGTAKVRLWIDVEGAVVDSELTQSSGYELLDREALEAASKYRFAADRCAAARREVILPLRFLPPGIPNPPAPRLHP